MERCLFNTCSDNVAGYCCCYRHQGAMTVKQIRAKGCLQKQCKYFKKNEDHNWWKQREATKQKRKARKERLYGGGVSV